MMSDLAWDNEGVAVRLSECHGLSDDRDGDDDDSSCRRNTNGQNCDLGVTSYSLVEI
jgi:hypothetical protein